MTDQTKTPGVPVLPVHRRLLELLYRSLNGGGDQLSGMEHGAAFSELKAILEAPAPQPPALGGELDGLISVMRNAVRDDANNGGREYFEKARKAEEDLRAHLAPLQAEIERLKAHAGEVTTYRDNAVKKIERLRNELTGTEKERDQLKGRNAELKENYRLAIAEMQAVIDTGALSSAQHEELEADVCASVKRFWDFSALSKPAEGEQV
ncbi:hypothetical protein KDX38_10760 [Pseudomonas sp. CDFA 602]|uniref:hypothetical protein n=1 Tax=Pseudomonas californiensis TaxID=2829823 RepID=UPI001E5915A5|nr:hypothetical protein [Pseudomonas californiensis]MCD5994202.1 hypothetical protein [Pseudomonas californiensis]MCD5999699.1 hypothetical protein [Pseudomonas californiensis]